MTLVLYHAECGCEILCHPSLPGDGCYFRYCAEEITPSHFEKNVLGWLHQVEGENRELKRQLDQAGKTDKLLAENRDLLSLIAMLHNMTARGA